MAAKSSKAEVDYEPKAHGEDHCGLCWKFLPPDHCKKVAGLINRGGWCKRFEAKKTKTIAEKAEYR